MNATQNPASPKASKDAREEAIFEAAVALAPSERAAYLARVCGEEAELRKRVEGLLQASEQAGDFLEPTGQSAAAGAAGTVVLSAPITEKPGDSIGRYKIRETLGEGGCGVVYVAEQAEPVRRRVALKIIKLGMDTRSVIARFEAERQALAMMDHPNIAKVLDAGTTETGRPYFVMELVRGIRITDYCDRNNLDTKQRLGLFIQVCHAIQHAHQKGIIHRDIKPSNILVTLHDGVPVPKVIDFGIAKATEGRLSEQTVYTELHQFIGTPAYMSPEQAEMSGLDIDTRSDIYSLGVLLYELLTGRTPFDARELVKSGLDQMRRTIREQEPVPPSTRLSTMLHADLTSVAKMHRAEAPKLVHFIRGDLDWIVMKALEKDRTRRFETASSLAADVQRFLNDELVEARPPSNVYRLQKLVRRNRTVFVAIGAVTAALLLGFGLSLYLFIKEKENYRRAVAAERQQAAMREAAEKGWAIEKRMRDVAPVASALTSAGYLLSQGEIDKADALMRDVPPIIPQSSAIYNVIGDQHARHGRWAAAISNYSRSILADPTNHLAYHQLAPLLVHTGDLGGFVRLRASMLEHFGNTSDPNTAERIAKDCLMLPPPAPQLPMIGRMADTAVKADPSDSSWTAYAFAKGLAEYRLGHFEEAGNWLQKVLAREGDGAGAKVVYPARTVQAYATLAMAQFQSKQTEAARDTLERAKQLAESKMKDGEMSWNDQIIAGLLLREAEGLIEGAPSRGQAK